MKLPEDTDISVAKLYSLITTRPLTEVAVVLKYWSVSSGILSVVRWKRSDPWHYALKVDLSLFNLYGEQAFMPFVWPKPKAPTLYQAVGQIRKQSKTSAKTGNKTSNRSLVRLATITS